MRHWELRAGLPARPPGSAPVRRRRQLVLQRCQLLLQLLLLQHLQLQQLLPHPPLVLQLCQLLRRQAWLLQRRLCQLLRQLLLQARPVVRRARRRLVHGRHH